MQVFEYYPERQGRPGSKVTRDIQSGVPTISRSYLVTLINQVLEDVMDERLKEMISALEELVVETRKANLHLTSLSNETIEDKDVEEAE